MGLCRTFQEFGRSGAASLASHHEGAGFGQLGLLDLMTRATSALPGTEEQVFQAGWRDGAHDKITLQIRRRWEAAGLVAALAGMTRNEAPEVRAGEPPSAAKTGLALGSRCPASWHRDRVSIYARPASIYPWHNPGAYLGRMIG